MESADGEKLSHSTPHCVQVGPLTIRVIRKELVEGGVDVLVCPYNNFWFKPSDELDYAIARAAGPNLRQDCKAWVVARKENMEPGSCMATDGHDLDCKKVVHVYCPAYQGAMEKVAVQQLEITMRNILVLVLQLQAASLALPLIGASTSYPATISTNVLVKLVLEVAKQLAGDPSSCPLREIQLVDTVDEHFKLIVQALDEHSPAAIAAAAIAEEQAAAGNKPTPSPILARAPPVRVEPKMLQVVHQVMKNHADTNKASADADPPTENGDEAHKGSAPIPTADSPATSNGRFATVRERVAEIVAFIEERVAEDGPPAPLTHSKPAAQVGTGESSITWQAHARRDSSSGASAVNHTADELGAAQGAAADSGAGDPAAANASSGASASGRVAQLANRWRAAARHGPPALSAEAGVDVDHASANGELSPPHITPADSAPGTPPPEPADDPAAPQHPSAPVAAPPVTTADDGAGSTRPTETDGHAASSAGSAEAAPAVHMPATASHAPAANGAHEAEDGVDVELPVQLSRLQPSHAAEEQDEEVHAPAIHSVAHSNGVVKGFPTLAELAVAAHEAAACAGAAADAAVVAPPPAVEAVDTSPDTSITDCNGGLKGIVKKFDDDKGWGFIAPQTGGGSKIFVHIRDVRASKLVEGDLVQYVEGEDRHGRRCATEVVVMQKARCRRTKGPKQAGVSANPSSEDLTEGHYADENSSVHSAGGAQDHGGDCGDGEAAAQPRSARRTRAFRQALGAAITSRAPS